MLFNEPLPFIQDYVTRLNKAIKICCPTRELSRIQQYWLSFCVMAVLVTNSICWSRFQKAGTGQYRVAALSWMFKKSRIPWEILLQLSVSMILKCYGITEGSLGIDDTDKKRSKSTRKIGYVHKIKDKPSGGYIMGQSIVFLVLVTPKVTIPVGFSFHMPDPALKAWLENDRNLKKNGVMKSSRPAKPGRDPHFPTIPQIAVSLLEQFKSNHPEIHIQCIFADALYGTQEFVDNAAMLFDGAQVISQIRANQLVQFRNKKRPVKTYFKSFTGTDQVLRVRGDQQICVSIGSARLHVHSHGKKRFVIALKYEGEADNRYIIASDMTWRTIDIVEAYTFRWLVEVFFQDWKGNEGWGKLTKHPGEEGSSRGLILSLMVDHCLLFHPDQLARIENNLPAYTVGSLASKIKVAGLLSALEQVITSEAPLESFKNFARTLENEMVTLRLSKKHMVSRELGNLYPSPALKYRKAA